MIQTLKPYFIVLVSTILITIIPGPIFAASPDRIEIKNIRYAKKTDGIIIEMSRKSTCEAIHIDENAILVAVKNGVTSQTGSIMNRDDQIVTDVSVDKLPGDILGLVIKTQKNISGIESNWLSDEKSLLITIK